LEHSIFCPAPRGIVKPHAVVYKRKERRAHWAGPYFFKERRRMAQFYLHAEDLPLADQIKSLEDDELLDFWEETQYLEKFLEEELESDPPHSVEYERLILQELQIRSCIRFLGR
jgi:hypothetical protein